MRTTWTGPGAPRRAAPLLAVSLGYLAVASGVMIWRGISVSPDYLLLLLVPVALLSGHVVRFLGDWVPFVALFLAWEAMRGIAARTGIPPHVGDLAKLETWLFFGHLPTAVLQDVASRLHLARGIDYLGTIVYFCHFVVPVAIGLALWLNDRTQFVRYTTTLLGMACIAFVVYLLLPTAPPWFAQDHGSLSGFRHVIGSTLPSAVSPYYNSLNPNPTAALPSLHSAFPFLGFLFLRHVYRRAAWLAFGWSALVWFSVVYLGEHYVIDVVTGVATAAASYWVMVRWIAPRIALLRGDDAQPTSAARPGGARAA